MSGKKISIFTKRLKLQPLSADKADLLFTLINNNKDSLQLSFPITVESAKNIITTRLFIEKLEEEMNYKLALHFGIYLEENLIGYVGLKKIDWDTSEADIAYYIDKQEQNKAYATEAVEKVCSYCFEQLNIKKLLINCISGNRSSIKVAIKSGFEIDEKEKNVFIDGCDNLCTLETYTLNIKKWKQLQ